MWVSKKQIGVIEMMNTKKREGIFVLVLLLSFIFVTDHSKAIHSAATIGDFNDFESFIWEVSYNNTFDPSTNKKTISKLILERVVDNERIWYNYNDSYGDYVSGWVEPDLTIQNFPLGTTSIILSIPTLQEIIPNLCFVPINWTENSLRFIDGNYTMINDIHYIENPTNSTIIHNRLFRYDSAIREVYIFEHYFVEDFVEDFTINTERVTGFSQAVYNERLGFLIYYNINLQSIGSSRSLNLSIELLESSQPLGWSVHFKRFVGFMCTGFPYFLSWIPILSIIFTKVYRKKKRELEILEGHRAVVAVKMKEKGLEEEDFCFINVCPFCLEELKKNQKKCPKCKGIR